MALNENLFRAILAMDAYNRGYNPGLVIAGTQIGNATLLSDADDPDGIARGASFFAQAYTWNGKTIISYRGTDQAFPDWETKSLGDALNGDLQTCEPVFA